MKTATVLKLKRDAKVFLACEDNLAFMRPLPSPRCSLMRSPLSISVEVLRKALMLGRLYSFSRHK